ncbi:MAG: LysR family transcriptional regulator [Eggerthellaceae bacterium]
MELRVLEYFLALSQEGSISAAAKTLNVSQPTLSRQLIDLENELGCILFERGKQGITLTEDGMLLRRRAGEISQLVHTTESELQLSHDNIAGTIHIGCGETQAMKLLTRVMKDVQEKYPQVVFDVVTDTAEHVAEKINKGLLDFGLMLRRTKTEGLEYLTLPHEEKTIVLLPKNSPLAEKDVLTLDDLIGVPLLVPATHRESGMLGGLEGKDEGGVLSVVAQFNFAYNAVQMVEEGLGVAVTLDSLTSTMQSSLLVTRPLQQSISINSYLAWKPFQFRSNACKIFLERAQTMFGNV